MSLAPGGIRTHDCFDMIVEVHVLPPCPSFKYLVLEDQQVIYSVHLSLSLFLFNWLSLSLSLPSQMRLDTFPNKDLPFSAPKIVSASFVHWRRIFERKDSPRIPESLDGHLDARTLILWPSFDHSWTARHSFFQRLFYRCSLFKDSQLTIWKERNKPRGMGTHNLFINRCLRKYEYDDVGFIRCECPYTNILEEV